MSHEFAVGIFRISRSFPKEEYVYAPYEARLENCTGSLGMDLKTAKRLIKEVDSARENYHKVYVQGYTSPFDNRDICIDSSKFGIDGTAMILSGIIKERF